VAALPAGRVEAVVAAAQRARSEGADVVEVPTDAAEVDAGVPVAVRTRGAEEVRAALLAGVVAIFPVDVAADPGAVVTALGTAAARLAREGLHAQRFVVEPVPAPGARLELPPAPGVRCVGAPVLVSVVRPDPEATDAGVVAGAVSVAVVRGCGLVRVAPADVRSARRVVDVVAAVRRGRAG
jgi:hypothetical protein